MRSLLVFLAATLAASAGCTKPETPTVRNEPAEDTVYVVVTGWHSGLVLSHRAVASANLIPERSAFDGAKFLEFGWGDRDYYPAPRPTVGLALGAAFASSASVMHLAGYDMPPQRRYADVRVFSVPLDARAQAKLIAAIDAGFARPDARPAEIVAPGLYPDSHFYAAHGRFSLANTCNTWTARMLAEAGLDISPSGVVTASGLADRVAALPGVGAAP